MGVFGRLLGLRGYGRSGAAFSLGAVSNLPSDALGRLRRA